MSDLSFKTFMRIMSEDTSEQELQEIFGLFRNNEKIEKLKAERERLQKQRAVAKKKFDDKWAAAKKREQDEKNGGFDPMERGSMTMRSQQAVGRAAERDWIHGMSESQLMEGFRHARAALLTGKHSEFVDENDPTKELLFRTALKILQRKVPEDKVWAYTLQEYPVEFARIMRKLGVTNPTMPDINDFKAAKMEKIRSMRGATFFKKGNVLILAPNSSDYQGATVAFVDGGPDIVAESFEITEGHLEASQLARQHIRNTVMPALAKAGYKGDVRGVEDFFLGGGGGYEMSAFIDWLNDQPGYVDGFSEYDEVKGVMKKIGVTRQLFNLFVRASQ